MGITDFTLRTLEGWLLSHTGRKHSLYPHKGGQYLGSAAAPKVYDEAGLNADSLFAAICAYAQDLKTNASWL